MIKIAPLALALALLTLTGCGAGTRFIAKTYGADKGGIISWSEDYGPEARESMKAFCAPRSVSIVRDDTRGRFTKTTFRCEAEDWSPGLSARPRQGTTALQFRALPE